MSEQATTKSDSTFATRTIVPMSVALLGLILFGNGRGILWDKQVPAAAVVPATPPTTNAPVAPMIESLVLDYAVCIAADGHEYTLFKGNTFNHRPGCPKCADLKKAEVPTRTIIVYTNAPAHEPAWHSGGQFFQNLPSTGYLQSN